jgi:hypothetical protein
MALKRRVRAKPPPREVECIHCSFTSDASTGLKPIEGSVTLCYACGKLDIMDGGVWRKLTSEEEERLEAAPEIKLLRLAREGLIEAKGDDPCLC